MKIYYKITYEHGMPIYTAVQPKEIIDGSYSEQLTTEREIAMEAECINEHYELCAESFAKESK